MKTRGATIRPEFAHDANLRFKPWPEFETRSEFDLANQRNIYWPLNNGTFDFLNINSFTRIYGGAARSKIPGARLGTWPA